MKVTQEIFIEKFVLMVEIVDGQRRGYLFGKQLSQEGVKNGERLSLYWPKSYGLLSEETRVRLLREEIDVYCDWSADEMMFGPWKGDCFEFLSEG